MGDERVCGESLRDASAVSVSVCRVSVALCGARALRGLPCVQYMQCIKAICELSGVLTSGGGGGYQLYAYIHCPADHAKTKVLSVQSPMPSPVLS